MLLFKLMSLTPPLPSPAVNQWGGDRWLLFPPVIHPTWSWWEWRGRRSLELSSGRTRRFQPERADLKNPKQTKEASVIVVLKRFKPHQMELCELSFLVFLSASSPAIMKTTPPARATLAFCSGWPDKQVVHFIPTEVTRMDRNASKTADNIRPRAPWMIAEDISDYRNVHTQFIVTLAFRSKMFRNSCLNLSVSVCFI